MKTKIFIMGLAFLLSISFIWAQPYEITEVDIFSLKKPISAKDITVRGINIENSIYEVLNKFGKNKSELISLVDRYIFSVEPGIFINTVDKKTIESIRLYDKFKEKLKGKTAGLFNLETSVDVARYIKMYFGEPDHTYSDSFGGMEANSYSYYNGFKFNWNFYSNRKPPKLEIWFELVSDEAIKPPISEDWEFLKDIDELGVLVERLSMYASEIGLSRERLITVVELKLRREGVKVVKAINKPYLYINVLVLENAFSILIELMEEVKIKRLNRIAYRVATWRTGATGIHGDDPEYIVSSLSSQLDEFLNDYYKANPKK